MGYLLVVGCASSPTVTTQQHLERATTQLERQTDADSLAAAGLFQVIKNHAQAVALLARAETAAPARADLVWLHLQVCQEQPSCDPPQVQAQILDRFSRTPALVKSLGEDLKQRREQVREQERDRG